MKNKRQGWGELAPRVGESTLIYTRYFYTSFLGVYPFWIESPFTYYFYLIYCYGNLVCFYFTRSFIVFIFPSNLKISSTDFDLDSYSCTLGASTNSSTIKVAR